MAKFAAVDGDGLVVGFYDSRINKVMPPDVVQISDETWRDWVRNQRSRRWQNGKLVDVGEAPSPYHKYTGGQWVEDATAKKVAEARLALEQEPTDLEVKVALIEKRTGITITEDDVAAERVAMKRAVSTENTLIGVR